MRCGKVAEESPLIRANKNKEAHYALLFTSWNEERIFAVQLFLTLKVSQYHRSNARKTDIRE